MYLDGKKFAAANRYIHENLKNADIDQFKSKKDVKNFVESLSMGGISKYRSSGQEQKDTQKLSDASNMTDEQKILRLRDQGKISEKAHHIFDQNGNLFMVYYDD